MNTVTEHKFVCLMHSEVKQTEMSKNVKVWYRERFIGVPIKENGWFKNPKLPNGLGGEVLFFFFLILLINLFFN